jgi:hypothetical protein
MYLPPMLPKARVLISVKTYPTPSTKYDELVCNAGFLEDGRWIRIYPVRYRALPYSQQYKKYEWIEVDLVRAPRDFRQESYSPRLGVDETIRTVGEIKSGKDRDWAERKRYALQEVFTSMDELITLAKTPGIWKSLATVKPREMINLEIEPQKELDWTPEFYAQLTQQKLFEASNTLQVVRKLPYKYYYNFVTDDGRRRRMMIADWEIGALYWKCLARAQGDQVAANEMVREKYQNKFFERDLYLFVGTTKEYHKIAENPFMIIGVFYPPKLPQLALDLKW